MSKQKAYERWHRAWAFCSTIDHSDPTRDAFLAGAAHGREQALEEALDAIDSARWGCHSDIASEVCSKIRDIKELK